MTDEEFFKKLKEFLEVFRNAGGFEVREDPHSMSKVMRLYPRGPSGKHFAQQISDEMWSYDRVQMFRMFVDGIFKEIFLK